MYLKEKSGYWVAAGCRHRLVSWISMELHLILEQLAVNKSGQLKPTMCLIHGLERFLAFHFKWSWSICLETLVFIFGLDVFPRWLSSRRTLAIEFTVQTYTLRMIYFIMKLYIICRHTLLHSTWVCYMKGSSQHCGDKVLCMCQRHCCHQEAIPAPWWDCLP